MASLKKLTRAQVEQFEIFGYVSPIVALSNDEVAHYHECLKDFLGRIGLPLDPGMGHKPHLYLKWVSDLAHHPNILGAVEDILGPNLLIWRSAFFIKQAHDPHYFPWHQDSAYWSFDSEAVITAWIALTDSGVENGCVRVVNGSHRRPDLPHTIRVERNNSLVHGQSAAVEIPEEGITNIELKAGEISLHHVHLLHGSLGNHSDNLRVGLVVRYVAPHVRRYGPRQSATLLKGVDEYGHFDHEPIPRYDNDPVAVAWHTKSVRRYGAELLWKKLMKPTPKSLLIAGRMIANRRMLKLAVRYISGWVNKRTS